MRPRDVDLPSCPDDAASTDRHRAIRIGLAALAMVLVYVLPRRWFGPDVSDQIIWTLGESLLTSVPMLMVIYLLALETRFAQGQSSHRMRLHPDWAVIVATAGLYAAAMGLLWLGLAEGDPTMLDRAALLIVGVAMISGPSTAAIVTVVALLVRAAVAVAVDAGSADLPSSAAPADVFVALWGLRWALTDPGVAAVYAGGLAGALANAWRQRRGFRAYPLWWCLPLVGMIEGAYAAAAWVNWGPVSAREFLTAEGPAKALGALAGLLVLMLMLRKLVADRERAEAVAVEQARLQAALDAARSELRYRQAEVKPHFLFNALNTINALIDSQPVQASTLVRHLAAMFRRLVGQRHLLVPLREELRHLDDYLAIESARFGDRVHVSVEVNEALTSWPVPFLCLQPLVENAIHHGLAGRASGGRVAVHAAAAGGILTLSVADDGCGMDQAPPSQGTGTGLANVRARFERLYGAAGCCRIQARAGGGTCVVLTVPSAPARKRPGGDDARPRS